ncbi:hypothetical protein Tlie_0214 [Thermovirga lienii DSM 17291]|uniref:YvrJ family protein n=1 Tax=Thermovirga lienii (strain ATCC BAA-1197 / DSM 17291 / Cas60314) TaxID=580340 RepID=G7V6C9_THELD|nr:YvrJ family protein [Thermovirga lienii]AER65958.1 hypothetical protein Tlie_0214 [Thermovirga lienii DSM 17291]
MEDFVASVAQGGFAVAVAAYLLVRMERRLDELTQAIRDLQLAIVNRGGTLP